MIMKLDTRLTSSAFISRLAAVVIPFTADWQLPCLTAVVRWIETTSVGYCFSAIYRPVYIRTLSRPEGQSSGYGLKSGGGAVG